MPGALRRAFGRLFGRPPRRAPEPAPDPAVASRAGNAIGRYAGEHAAILERAERLATKARRLDETGTPSESANNRAVRAWAEVEAGLAAQRGQFVASDGEEGGVAFDREVGRRFPQFRPHGRNT